jgi:hypothetical protein
MHIMNNVYIDYTYTYIYIQNVKSISSTYITEWSKLNTAL